ncbi:hypothetical protein KW798_02990 [Candidatus Parcubacteria bacterium]|nr:hypothetical protein [Candidatus Parcubacteria bacterium]
MSGFVSAMLAAAMFLTQSEAPMLDRDDFLAQQYELSGKVDFTGPFGWKDGVAAAKVGMSATQYAVEGMEKVLRDRLYLMLREMRLNGLDTCINAGYRGPERQAMITAGVRASANNSFHGGAKNRRGHGHGLAADLVSCLGGDTNDQRFDNSKPVWRWIDTHGLEFKLGRPYLHCDPPHVGPSDGGEYRAKYPTAAVRFKDGKDEYSRCVSQKKKKRGGKGKKRR